MRPVQPNAQHLAYWSEIDPRPVTIGGPEEGPDVIPCPALLTYPDGPAAAPVVRVGFEVNEVELAHLARGGTIWLSTWGGLPIHMMEVQPPPQPECHDDTGVEP